MFRIIKHERIVSPVRITNGQTQLRIGSPVRRVVKVLRFAIETELTITIRENSVAKRSGCLCPNEKRLFERANLVCAS